MIIGLGAAIIFTYGEAFKDAVVDWVAAGCLFPDYGPGWSALLARYVEFWWEGVGDGVGGAAMFCGVPQG